MNILFAAAECAPLAKVGGLGDVIGSLPKALKQHGIDARVILPMYKNIPAPAGKNHPSIKLKVSFGGQMIIVTVNQTVLPDSDVVLYLLEEPTMFGSGGVYEMANAGPGGESEIKKFLFFSQCVTEFIKHKLWAPDLLHVHDWHLSLTPLLLKLAKLPTPTLLTIHNLAMQGLASIASLETLDGNIINQPSLREDLAKFGKINLLRQGILHADAVSTVSPTYATEIITPEFGERLEIDLKTLNKVYGIINGIDYAVWDPGTDHMISDHYTAGDFSPKQLNKRALQQTLSLKVDDNIPLVGVVSRLTGQKGFDLLEPIRAELETLDFQMAILGLGAPKIEDLFSVLCQKYPQKFILHKKFDEPLAHHIYAASDLFLMPSRFEPCGLGQMIAMRYGSVPIVRATGGLKDTVVNIADDLNNKGFATGFVFSDYKPQKLLSEISRAINLYHQDKQSWTLMIKNAMTADFSWQNSAKKYTTLYEQIINS